MRDYKNHKPKTNWGELLLNICASLGFAFTLIALLFIAGV
jgi:hypothetical protein